MKTAMSNGTAALLAMQKAMAVESNNAGNVKSLAFKSDYVSFTDMFYSNYMGNGNIGRSTEMLEPRKNYSQGELVPTNSAYDFAIDGEGFFPVKDLEESQIYYTRAGQFNSNSENVLSDGEGNVVLGIRPDVSGETINATHTKTVTSQVIERVTGNTKITTSFNTYITDYETTIKALTSTGTSGDGYKTSGSIVADLEKMLDSYKSALKTYSINPVDPNDPTENIAPEKASAEITIAPLVAVHKAYSLSATINGVKFQQDFEKSVENTLNLFADKISGFAGMSATVNTTTGKFEIESMIPGEKLTLSGVELNQNRLPFTLTKEVPGKGLIVSETLQSEIDKLFDRLNKELETTLTTKYNGFSDSQKFSIYNSLDADTKSKFIKDLGEDYASLQTKYDPDNKLNSKEVERKIFDFLHTTYKKDVETYMESTFKSRYTPLDIAENRSAIKDPLSGVVDPDNLIPIVLDLNELKMNTTLYDKLESDSDTIAAYPKIESENGKIYLSDGDQKFLIGLIMPVTFSDKTLLKPEGKSLYTITPDPLKPGSIAPDPTYIHEGAIVVGEYLEYSNVDISAQLVNLLSFQKAFEANSKSISTSDEMMKTALALKTK